MNMLQAEGARKTGSYPEISSWRGLYRLASVSAVLYVLLIIVPVVLLFAVPQPPLVGGAATLQYIASHKVIYLIEFISFVGLSLPALVVFLALYGALAHLNKGYAALGSVIGMASEIIALAYNSSPPSLHGGLLNLSDQYMRAATTIQQTIFATAAEGLMATANTVNAAGILTALGILILSLVMLKGVFPQWAAFLGITTGVMGIVCEALRDMIGPLYFIYGLLLPTWFLVVGWKLSLLGSMSESTL